MKKLSVEEYAKIIDVSPKTIYRRIERGQLITCKDMVNNKEVIRIIVEDNEMLSHDMSNTIECQVTDDVMTPGKNPYFIDVDQKDKYLELIKQMYEDNRHLAELAGQTKLLTDSEHQTKQQYFQLTQENKVLAQEKAELKAKLEERTANLTQQLELTQEKLKELENKLKEPEPSKFLDWLKRL